MPPDLNKSLEQCEAQAKALVMEIQQYKASRMLNQTAVDSLEKVSASLNRVIEEIKPLTGVQLRRFYKVQTIAWCVTTVLVVALIVSIALNVLKFNL